MKKKILISSEDIARSSFVGIAQKNCFAKGLVADEDSIAFALLFIEGFERKFDNIEGVITRDVKRF